MPYNFLKRVTAILVLPLQNTQLTTKPQCMYEQWTKKQSECKSNEQKHPVSYSYSHFYDLTHI